MALQIRTLREQRHLSQTCLGEHLGTAPASVSRLENPDYGKMTVATLLRLAAAFDTDLEIKFRPFSTTIDALSRQSSAYFSVPSFDDEFAAESMSNDEESKAFDLLMSSSRAPGNEESASKGITGFPVVGSGDLACMDAGSGALSRLYAAS